MRLPSLTRTALVELPFDLKRYDEVTAEDVKRLANEVLSRELTDLEKRLVP